MEPDYTVSIIDDTSFLQSQLMEQYSIFNQIKTGIVKAFESEIKLCDGGKPIISTAIPMPYMP